MDDATRDEARVAWHAVQSLLDGLAALGQPSPWRAGVDAPTFALWAERAHRILETRVRPGTGALVVLRDSWIAGRTLADEVDHARSALIALGRAISAHPEEYGPRVVQDIAENSARGAAAARRRFRWRKRRKWLLHSPPGNLVALLTIAATVFGTCWTVRQTPAREAAGAGDSVETTPPAAADAPATTPAP